MATKKNVVRMKPDVSAQLETLRADVALLAETIAKQTKTTVADKAATVKAAAVEKAANVKTVASDTSETAIARYEEVTGKAKTNIQANPLTSVAVAVAAGFILSALVRR